MTAKLHLLFMSIYNGKSYGKCKIFVGMTYRVELGQMCIEKF